jgi:hypothetical protein
VALRFPPQSKMISGSAMGQNVRCLMMGFSAPWLEKVKYCVNIS